MGRYSNPHPNHTTDLGLATSEAGRARVAWKVPACRQSLTSGQDQARTRAPETGIPVFASAKKPQVNIVGISHLKTLPGNRQGLRITWPAPSSQGHNALNNKRGYHANIATTRIYDHRKTRHEDSPTFKVAY